MKRLLLFLLLLSPFYGRADHVSGIDLNYKYVSGNTYRVFVTIYGQCGASNFNSLAGGTPEILVLNNNTIFTHMYLNLIPDSTKNVSPYCTAQKNNTTCTVPSSTQVGVMRYVYSDTVTLSGPSANWVFRFTSSTSTSCGGRTGRPKGATNVQIGSGGSGTNIVLEATLNNTGGNNNSSPAYNTQIYPFYCINVPASYNQLATDPDHDSLTYALVPALQQTSSNCDLNPTLVTYIAPYTFSNPLGVVPGSFNFSTQTGTINFIPNMVQISVVDTKISEYRNGVLVGTAARERVFYVLGTCNNTPPSGNIDSATVVGGHLTAANTITACPGGIIKFSVPVTDANGDTVKATISNIFSGSNLTLTANNTKSPKIDFSWNTDGMTNGTYSFLAFYTDNGCPLASSSLISYTIQLINAGDITPTVVAPTNCLHKAFVQYDLQNGIKPYTFTVKKDTALIGTYANAASTITDSLSPGLYTLTLNSTGLSCTTVVKFEVKDDGPYPFTPKALSPVDYCRNADAVPLQVKTDSNTTTNWYDDKIRYIGNTFTPPTNVSGTFVYYVSQKYKTCESAKDSVVVNISQDSCNFNLIVHNVITPNGDGKNDKWVIENLEYYPDHVVQLFDKLGDKVYERTSYGNDFDGGNLPSGMYYYMVNLKAPNKVSGKDHYTGYLMIKR